MVPHQIAEGGLPGHGRGRFASDFACDWSVGGIPGHATGGFSSKRHRRGRSVLDSGARAKPARWPTSSSRMDKLPSDRAGRTMRSGLVAGHSGPSELMVWHGGGVFSAVPDRTSDRLVPPGLPVARVSGRRDLSGVAGGGPAMVSGPQPSRGAEDPSCPRQRRGSRIPLPCCSWRRCHRIRGARSRHLRPSSHHSQHYPYPEP